MGAAAGTPISSSGDDGKDTKHVAAGLKGCVHNSTHLYPDLHPIIIPTPCSSAADLPPSALHNANVSTAAKVDAAGKLRDMGELAK